MNDQFDEAFVERLREKAHRAETSATVRLGGLSDRQLMALLAAGDASDEVGSYDVSNLSTEQFFMVMRLGDEIERAPLTEDEREEGRRLLAERSRPPEF